MKQRNKAIWTMFLLAILTLLGGLSIVQSSFSTASDKALAFIENALPFDSERYSVALKHYSVTKMPDLGSTQPIYGKQETLTYTLESEDSEADVVCTLQDGVLYMCNVYTMKGAFISDRKYSNVTDAAVSFLQKYQSNSKIDSTEMIATLSNVVPTKDATITSGDLKLIVTHQDLTGTVFGDTTDFRWVRVINGCEYQVVYLSFSDGAFSGILDNRQRYSIGDTSVNISEEQAIKIALEAIKNYSYPMSDDWIISGFNVNEDQITANLHPRTREDNVLYPVWSVLLPLDGVYPGSVRELLVGIWAGSGEVYLVHHQAYGGADLTSDGNSELSDTSPSSSSSSENSAASVDISTIAMVAAVATVVVIAASVVFIKKRSK